MEFRKTDYILKAIDGRNIVAESWINGVRYFRMSDGKIQEARKTRHYCIVEEEKSRQKLNPLLERIVALEARIAQLENTLDNKLEKDKV